MKSWVYIQTEKNLYTVGFFDPEAKWHSDSDHDTQLKAAMRVSYLNGNEQSQLDVLGMMIQELTNRVSELEDYVNELERDKQEDFNVALYTPSSGGKR